MSGTKPDDRPQTRRWRERAFLQPLLVTIIGVAALPALVLAWSLLTSASSDSSPCTGECGTARMAGALITGIGLLLVWFAVMLIAGFDVGRSSRDSGLAFRAVLLAIVGLALTTSIVYTVLSTASESPVDTVFMFMGLGCVPLEPSLALGLPVGHSSRRKRPRRVHSDVSVDGVTGTMNR